MGKKRKDGGVEAMLRHAKKQLLQRSCPPIAKHANETWIPPVHVREENGASGETAQPK